MTSLIFQSPETADRLTVCHLPDAHPVQKVCVQKDKCSGTNMCNPAEEAVVNNGSDSKRNDAHDLKTDNLVTCAHTSACVSVEPSKANSHPSTGCMIDAADKAGHLSTDSLTETDVTDDNQPPDTSENSAKEVHASGEGGQEVIEQVDHSQGSSTPCTAMATSFSDGDEIAKDDVEIPNIPLQNSSETLLHHCNSNLDEHEDDGHPMPAEYRMVKNSPTESEPLSERSALERENGWIERVESEEEALHETSVGEPVSLDDASDGGTARSSTSAVIGPLDSTSLCDGTESCGNASDELCMCPNNEPRKPEREMHIVRADDGIHAFGNLLPEALEFSEDHLTTWPCNDTNSVVAVHNSDSSFGGKEQVLKTLDEPLAGMNGRLGKISSVMAISFTEDASEHVPSSFNEAVEETTSEIEQEDDGVPTVTVVLEGHHRPELARFFDNARGSKLEKEIEEQQDCASALAELPIKNKIFMESPRSLRMLLFSEQTALLTKKEEKHRKDGKCIEFSSKVVPAAESHGDDKHMEHSYPSKWYEDADTTEISSAFSGPIAFSGSLAYQGLISFSGQAPYSGNISHRSDSSTSTRSFAFPILASEWNSSPVKMGAPDPQFYRKRRKWYFCFCCVRSATLFD